MFTSFALRHSRLVLAAWLLPALTGAVLFLGRFGLDNSVGVWFPKDDPALAAYEKHLETFGPWEWTLLLIEPAPSGGMSPGGLASLEGRLGEIPGIRRVLDPREVASLMAQAGDGPAGPVSSRSLPVLLETANEIHRGDGFREQLLDRIRSTLDSLPGIASYTVVGTSVINVGLNRSAKRDMLLFFNLVFVLLLTVSLVLLRSLRDTLVILGMAVSAVTLTLGTASLLGHRFNILTIMMPTLLIALSVANLVHLVHAFHQARRDGASPSNAAVLAAREVRLPSLGATLTTVMGFLSLAVSDMPPVRQLALFSAAGISLAWIGTLGVAPVLLARVWRGHAVSPAAGTHGRVLDSWARRLSRIGPLLILLLAGSLPVLAGIGRLEADTNYVEFFRPGSRVREAYERMAAAGIPQTSLEISVQSAGRLSSRELDPFLRGIQSMPETRGLLPPEPEASGRKGEMEHASRVVLFLEFLGNDAVGGLVQRIRGVAADRLPPGVEIDVTGSPVLWERMDASIVRTQRDSILIVAVGAFVLLAVLFRSLRAALVGWIGSALPVGLILGLMGWLEIPVTLATVLIAGITLGLAVDDTVHLVTDFRRRMDAGHRPATAARQAVTRIGERMVVTSLILATSFSAMALSDFTPTAEFGMLTALTILLALAADLTFLPWILGRERFWHIRSRRRKVSTEAHTGVHDPSPIPDHSSPDLSCPTRVTEAGPRIRGSSRSLPGWHGS